MVANVLAPDSSGLELFETASRTNARWQERFIVVTGFATEPAFEEDLRQAKAIVLRSWLRSKRYGAR